MVEKKKRKKKGRPSLLDLQKRSLREQQEQKNKQKVSASHSSDDYRTVTASSLRRTTRRNAASEAEDEDEESEGDRREKKLKLVLKPLPQKSPVDSAVPLNSPDSEAQEDRNSADSHRKRKINASRGGSGVGEREKLPIQCLKFSEGMRLLTGLQSSLNIGPLGDQSDPVADKAQDNQLDLGPSTPLPAKKLLLFILDRLQKKDTYGVFAEPVDPEELPDYHEIIKHPMDFQTIRNKLDAGAYADLEQFEKDVFLICSNAMQYNAPDTIYFRQARSIEELAKKSFENLRQDSDNDESELKVERRGRPPMKNIIRKMMGKPSLEHTASDFSSGRTPAFGAENNEGNLSSDKANNVYASWLSENKFERSDKGSMLKNSRSVKNGKSQFRVDENRRDTYTRFHLSNTGRESSVPSTFRGQRKQLLPVGLHTEHGYARSLAHFAAQLGTVAWKVASRRIEKCLPAEVKFGPRWVGENDTPALRPLLSSQCQSQTSSSDNLCTPKTSFSAISSSEPRKEKPETAMGLNSHSGFNVPSSNVGVYRSMTAFQIHPGMNGINGTYWFNYPTQTVKLTANSFNTENSKLSENSVTMSYTSQLPNSGSLQQMKQDSGLPRRQDFSNSDAPDLNAKFQSAGSPSSCQVDSTQPDLALQL